MSDVKYDAEKLQQDAKAFLESFKQSMTKIADECISNLYTDCLPHIETDSWTNYREALRLEVETEYKESKFKSQWAMDLRRTILKENRDELVKLLNHDLLVRIKQLEDQLREYERFRYTV